jgi:hypothetical protein
VVIFWCVECYKYALIHNRDGGLRTGEVKQGVIMTKTVGSVRKIKGDIVREILVQAVMVNANLRARRGFDALRAFVEKMHRVTLPDKVLAELLKQATVSSASEISDRQRSHIRLKASRLNGTRDTDEGRVILRVFAAKEFGILVDNHTISQLLREHDVANDSSRRWCTGIIPQYSGYMHRPSLPE